MTRRDELHAILERVKNATGLDRELDIALWRTLDDGHPVRVPLPWLKRFTESIDAAVALVERVLPGWEIGTQTHALYDADCSLAPADEPPQHWGEGKTLPLAILAALLSALIYKAAMAEAEAGRKE